MEYTAHNSGKSIFFVVLVLLCLGLGGIVATVPFSLPLLAAAGAFLFFIGFAFPYLAMIFLIYAMLLSPEYVIGSAATRDIVIRIDDLLIIVFAVAWLARLAVSHTHVFVKTPLNRPILVYCSLFILLTLRGMILGHVIPLKGFFYILKYVEYFLIYFIVAGMINDKKQIKSFLKAFCVTFVIVNIYAFFQIGVAGRVSAPFEGTPGEPNTLGGYQVLMFGVIIGLLTHVKNMRWRWPLIWVSFFSLIPFVFTLSRASYMAFIPMYFTLIIFNKFKTRNILIGFLITMTILGIFFFPQNVKERLQYTFVAQEQETIKPVKIGSVTLGPSASARIQSWIYVYNAWRNRPFFGYGVTGLGFIDSQYMRTLAELGVLGFLAFSALLISIFRNTLRIYRSAKDDWLKGLALGFLAGHVGMIFHALTANTYIIIRIMEPYWFLAAMVMMIPKVDDKPEEKIKPVEPKVIESYPRMSKFLVTSGKFRF